MSLHFSMGQCRTYSHTATQLLLSILIKRKDLADPTSLLFHYAVARCERVSHWPIYQGRHQQERWRVWGLHRESLQVLLFLCMLKFWDQKEICIFPFAHCFFLHRHDDAKRLENVQNACFPLVHAVQIECKTTVSKPGTTTFLNIFWFFFCFFKYVRAGRSKKHSWQPNFLQS